MANTPLRSIRISDDIWKRAQHKAQLEGVPLSWIVVMALTEYVDEEYINQS